MKLNDSPVTATERVLELGCGFTKRPGAFGIDMIEGSQADLIHDLDVTPYPLASDAWDRIVCRDVLEHVERFVPVMEEIWRVGRAGAMVEISGPFMSSVNYFSDPTHRRAFTSRSFDYFIAGTPGFRLGYSRARFELVTCEYDPGERQHRRGLHRWLLDWANRNKAHYENRYAFLYPVYNIHFELRVVK
jgi:SAM-dependent methyltransferase